MELQKTGTAILLSKEQKQYLLDNYKSSTNLEMAKHLGVSESKVRTWLKDDLGIEKKRITESDKQKAPKNKGKFFDHNTKMF